MDRLEGGKCNPATLWGGLLKIEINSIEGGLRSQWTLDSHGSQAPMSKENRKQEKKFSFFQALYLFNSEQLSKMFLGFS